MIKRTLKLSGHQTSVALEPEFWHAIDEFAVSKDLSWSHLVAEIDSQRERSNLASTLRVAALSYFASKKVA